MKLHLVEHCLHSSRTQLTTVRETIVNTLTRKPDTVIRDQAT